MTIRSSLRVSVSLSYRNSQPRTGMSEMYGTPREIFSFVDEIIPPSMTVSPSWALTAVMIWVVSIVGEVMTCPSDEKTGIASLLLPRLDFSAPISIMTRPSLLIRGVTSRISPTLASTTFDVTP